MAICGKITHQGGEWVGETPPSQLTLHPREKDSPAEKNEGGKMSTGGKKNIAKEAFQPLFSLLIPEYLAPLLSLPPPLSSLLSLYPPSPLLRIQRGQRGAAEVMYDPHGGFWFMRHGGDGR